MNLYCVFLEADGLGIRVTSTDGHRLTSRTSRVAAEIDGGFDPVLLCRPAIDTLAMMLRRLDSDSDVTIEVAKGNVTIRVQDASVRVRQLGVPPPNWRAVTRRPDEATTIRVNRAALLAAVKDAAKVARRKDEKNVSYPVRITVAEDSGQVMVSAKSPDASYVSKIDADVTIGSESESEVTVNAPYLVEVLGDLDADVVTIAFSGFRSPIFFDEGKKDDVHVVMQSR